MKIFLYVAKTTGDAALAGYAALLALAVTAAATDLVWAGQQLAQALPIAALALLSAVAERSRVRLSNTIELSISLLPTLFTAVVFGPLAAMVVGGASMLGDFPIGGRRRYEHARLRWAIYTLTEALTGCVTGAVATVVRHLPASHLGAITLATAAGALVSQVTDVGFGAVMMKLRRVGDPRDLLRTLTPPILASVPLYTPIVALLAYMYIDVSVWTLPFFLAPALAAQRLFALYQEQRRLNDDVLAVNVRLERANMSFATALVATLDARDRYTAGHSAAVAIYARDIAARIGLSEDLQQRAHLAGLVHDIGKIGLPAGLLEKAGPLTLDERRQMETHSAIGARILANVDDYTDIAAVVRHHHERVDGEGYPDGLCYDAIPLLARIIAVADAYNAMTSDRPYRDAMPSRVARLRLAQAVETQFDTTVVAAFEAILAGADEQYRTGARTDFKLAVQEDWSELASSAVA